jgi:glycosyltransferase involved in cell wall biosynthesis
MLVTYVAPNGSWHYRYASALARADRLQRFVCGLPRFSPRAPLPELGDKLLRVDHLQSLYLASQKMRMPSSLTEELSFLSKVWLDRCAEKDARCSDAFVFYSGAGLHTLSALKSTPVRGVVEVVNSHVLVQKEILREEHERLRLPFRGFHAREVERRIREYEQVDGIICPSTFAQQSYIDRGMKADRVRVVPFGVHPSSVPEPQYQPRDQETFRVLFVGQINIRKGLRYLFQAFRKFKHPKKELWIVGPKAEPSGIEDLSPPEQTRFLGVLKGDALARAYRSCHVFVLPTIEEGLALVLGEALSYGLPVIATVNSGGADIITEGETGFLVPIRSPEAITEKLQLLADNPDLYAKMSARTVMRDKGMRSWENTCQMFIQTLEDFTRMPKL